MNFFFFFYFVNYYFYVTDLTLICIIVKGPDCVVSSFKGYI